MSRIHHGRWHHRWAVILGAGLLLAGSALRADNLKVAKVTLVPASATDSFIQFDLAWQNSWRTVQQAAGTAFESWDAAWVFVKYRRDNQNGSWRHATLAPDGHQAPAGVTIAVGTSEAKGAAFGAGAFIYRSAAGESGPNDWQGIKLRWRHEADAVAANTIPEVLAIEMVYVPEGAFWAGDGLPTRCRFAKTLITQADPTKDGGRPTGTSAPENGNSLWPNGYRGFYCMKYEVTFREFMAFLKANADTAGSYAIYPYRKDLMEPADPGAPRGWLSWRDGAAFAAWAGLRPMTELEYEKACRGPLAPVAGEFAWGSTNRPPPAAAAPTAATAAPKAFANPAPNGGVSREAAGASYWGIVDLSGGLWERAVTIDNTSDYAADKGRQFRGTHGTGTPNLPDDWPDNEGNGAGFRGGAAGLAVVHMAVSDRYSATYVNGSRGLRNGFRAVRSAP